MVGAPKSGSHGRQWIAEVLVLASLLSVSSGCSSPARKIGAGDESPSSALRSPGDANPFLDPRDAGAGPSREELVARFFAARGIAFEVAAEAEWVALEAPAAVLVTIRNAGAKPLRLVGERTTGIWPFSDTERARTVLHAAMTFASLRAGSRTTQDDLPIEQSEEIFVPAGGERTLRLQLPLELPQETVYARVLVRPLLHPLAIVVGDEPERVITLRLPEVAISFAPARVVAAPADDEGPLEGALAERPEEVVAAAVRLAERDRVPTVERLVQALPGPDARARRARCVALEWITGLRLGDSVERWRSWWGSEEGAKFVREASAPARDEGRAAR